MQSKEKPFVLIVAELIYSEVLEIKKKNPQFTNIDAVDAFIGTKMYKKLSTGQFHDEWFERLKKDNFFDKKSKKKVSQETLRLLEIQKDAMIKQLIQFPKLYYAKSHFPLEINQRALDHLWRMCESYELWCRESKRESLIFLKIID